MKLGLLMTSLAVGCGSHAASKESCAAPLAELARFYEAAANDRAVSPPDPRRAMPGLVTVEGRPQDPTKSDYLLIGPTSLQLVRVGGEVRDLSAQAPDGLDARGTSSLVIAVAGTTPWPIVRATLDKATRAYPSIAFAYAVDGAFAGRKLPQVEGADRDRVDITGIGNALAKTTADHCPAIAAEMAKLGGAARIDSPELLRAIAAKLPTCECAVDTALIEALPWLVRPQVVTLVPLAATATMPAETDARTWAELVRANGGKPLAIAMPPPSPPPPPPPPGPKGP